MQAGGLSLQQAPPIGVPFRFFLTAPLFLAAAAGLVLWEGPAILATRYAPATLALTHLLTLGVMAMVMCGALLQVLPVVVGSAVPWVRVVGTGVHLMLTFGTLLLAAGFLWSWREALLAGGLVCGGGLLAFLGGMVASLWRARSSSTAVRSLWVAAGGLAVTVLLGLALVAARAGALTLGSGVWANLHPAWGLTVWTTALVVAVASQVVPMFMLTPQYPGWLTGSLAVGMLGLLLARSAASFLSPFWLRLVLPVLDVSLALSVLAFALATVWLQARRKRRLPDVTLPFWRVAMGSLVGCVLLWCAQPFVSDAAAERLRLSVTAVAIMGFAVTVISGMLYRIVPFLCWFHLHSEFAGRIAVPNMKQFIPDAGVRVQGLLWNLGLALLALTLAALPHLARWAALVTMLASLALLLNLLRAVHLFRATARAAAS
jgi:hypothetical protein